MGEPSIAKRKIIIDTDAGIDDAQAIFMALSRPDVEVVAITTVTGNVNAHQVCLNVARALKVAERLDIPIYQGASSSLLGIDTNASYYHGHDGFGDVPDSQAPDKSLIQSENAVNIIIKLVKQFPGELSIVALGPLTNIALALRLDSSLGGNLKGFYAMGGNHKGRGNVTPQAEFNFHADPEAAFIVLNDLQLPITLVTWETCLKYSFCWDWYDKYVNIDTPKGRFIHKIDRTTLERFYRKQDGKEANYIMADQILMAVFLDGAIVQNCENCYCTVELAGQLCRGELVVDWTGQLNKTKNVQIVTRLDQEKLSKSAMHGLQN